MNLPACKQSYNRSCGITDPSLPSIDLKVPEGRNNLWGKTKAAFKYIHEHHLDDADWFLKSQDKQGRRRVLLIY